MTETITIQQIINAPAQKVWDYWTQSEHIIQWNAASDDWHTPQASNDLRVGGKFLCRMEAKDGSMGFDFSGTYTEVLPLQKIAYAMDDNRNVIVTFEEEDGQVRITEEFEAESENPIEMQKDGWQAILDNFKKYTES